MTLAGKWVELEIILSKASQTKTNNMFLYVNIYARVSCVDVCVWMCGCAHTHKYMCDVGHENRKGLCVERQTS